MEIWSHEKKCKKHKQTMHKILRHVHIIVTIIITVRVCIQKHEII